MSNSLSGLIPTIYEALDIVSREMIGFIPAVSRNSRAERASLNVPITAQVCPALSAADIVPSGTLPDPSGITYGSTTCAITKSRAVRVPWDLEEINSVDSIDNFKRDAFAQAFRTLSNEIEADLAALYPYASRAYGTAGATPFQTAGDLSDLAFTREILEVNGFGMDMHCVLNSSAIAMLRAKQGIIFKVNESGSAERQASGNIVALEGFQLHSSGQVANHTAGTGAAYDINHGGGYAIGSTSLVVDTGTGTILAGDVIANVESGRDANKYVVKTALNTGTFVIRPKGLLKAWNDDDTIGVSAFHACNMAFTKGAILLLARLPQRPEDDAAVDVTTVIDPVSGLPFEVSKYAGYRKIWYEIAAAWGVKAVKEEGIALLLG